MERMKHAERRRIPANSVLREFQACRARSAIVGACPAETLGQAGASQASPGGHSRSGRLSERRPCLLMC